jgi:hypothetical protein
LLRKIIGAACVVAIALGTAAWAGDMAKQEAATGAKPSPQAMADKMAATKAAMMNCSVCKHMAIHMDELGPVMKMEVAKLNDGIAMMHSVTDPAKVETFHAVGKQMGAAGESCMAMTDEQAKTALCEFCQDIRSVMKAGAKMSQGDTKMGDIMVITSADAAVQAKISALGDKCAMMAESM